MKRFIASPYLVWSILFIVIPLFLVLLFSIMSCNIENIDKLSFTFDNYKRIIDSVYINVFFRSIKLAVICTIICLVIGYPVALILARENYSIKNTLVLLFIVPMWMNFLLRTYAWMSILGRNGFVNTALRFIGLDRLNILYNNGAVILGMVYNFLPFMVLPIFTVLSKIDNTLIEAGEDLGANRIIVFKRIILPLSIPGVMSGVTMVFMPAVSTFVIPRLLGGGQYMLVGNLIEQQFLFVGDWNFGSAISILMMIIILISMGIMNKYDNGDKDERLW